MQSPGGPNENGRKVHPPKAKGACDRTGLRVFVWHRLHDEEEEEEEEEEFIRIQRIL